MLQKTTKKQAKKLRRKKLLILFLIFIFLSLSVFLLRQILFEKKPVFISPISNLGFYQNTDFETKLRKSKIDYENLKFINNYYQFNIKGEGMVIISIEKNIDSQLSSLQLTLRQLKIEGRRFKSLDFRFDKPVIVLL